MKTCTYRLYGTFFQKNKKLSTGYPQASQFHNRIGIRFHVKRTKKTIFFLFIHKLKSQQCQRFHGIKRVIHKCYKQHRYHVYDLTLRLYILLIGWYSLITAKHQHTEKPLNVIPTTFTRNFKKNFKKSQKTLDNKKVT